MSARRLPMIHYSHNNFHLGDNLIHLHFLRKLAAKYPGEAFVHAVHECHLPQLREAIVDMEPQVRLIPFEQRREDIGRDVWKNAGGFWERHIYRNHFGKFYVDWFELLARQMGLESPIRNPQDLWFDYPKAVERTDRVEGMLRALSGPDWSPAEGRPRFDFLVVNSRPCSGQFRAYDNAEYLTMLILDLCLKGYKVVCTQPIKVETRFSPDIRHPILCTRDYNLTISEVGALSLHADHLVMVSTGPSWPTFNVWNVETMKLRLLLLDTEVVDYMPNIVQVNSREAAKRVLQERGLL